MSNDTLPINRKSEFKYLMKYRWKALLIIGGIIFLFSVPLLVSLFLKDLKAISIVTTSEGSDISTLLINDLFYAVFIIPSFIVLFIGLAGVYRIIRNYVWTEGVLLKSDFFIGIKQNWKHFAITGFLFSLMYYGIYLSALYISVPFVKYLPFALCVIFIYPVLLVHMNLTVIYKNNYLMQFKNALYLYIKRFYIYLPLFLLLILIPFLISVFSIPLLAKYIILLFFIYLFIPFYILGISLYSISVFDENINKSRHKDLYKKGLF